MELQKNAAYIHSLEKLKTRLTGEAEDVACETEREGVKLRAKEKAAKAMADIMKERRAKESAEPACHSIIRPSQLTEPVSRLVHGVYSVELIYWNIFHSAELAQLSEGERLGSGLAVCTHRNSM